MPRRPTADTIATAQQAADHLAAHGKADYADAVRAVIQAVPASWSNTGTPALVVHVPVEVHARIQELTQAGQLKLRDEMRRACDKYTEGAWVPAAPERAKPGTAPKTKSVSSRLPMDLREQVDAYGAEHAEQLAEAGWSTPPTPRQLCWAWLVEKFTPQDAPAE